MDQAPERARPADDSAGEGGPERPAAVPEAAAGLSAAADFDEYAGRWGLGAVDESGSWQGPWRFWTVKGRLDEEAEYARMNKSWSRLYDDEGAIRHEIAYEGDGVLHGGYRRRF